MAKELERYRQIERSIITTYRKQLWSPFVLAVKKYRLIEAGDRIALSVFLQIACHPAGFFHL